MTAYRSAYGEGNFSAYFFGVEGSFVDASAVSTATSSGTVSGVKLKSGSASISATASSDVVVNAIRTNSGSVTATSTVTASADKFHLEDASNFAYGSGAYGIAEYAGTDLQTIVIGQSSTASVGAVRIRLADGALDAVSALTSDGTRIRTTDATVSADSGSTASGSFSVVGNATISAVSTNTSDVNRVRNTSGSTAIASVLTATGRYRYEPRAKDNESWTAIERGTEIWTEVA